MKKTLSIVLILSVLFCMVLSVSGCGSSADYPAPLDAYRAYCDGEDVVGKTVDFTVNDSNAIGRIFFGATPDFSSSVELYVTDNSAEKLEEGDSATLKISSVETSLAEVDFYGTIVD
ncbi:MAG: hypothetical protein IKE53_05525 [Clostridiales bacterium]|nr:hypothetical protein [Clostridiales bacterium]